MFISIVTRSASCMCGCEGAHTSGPRPRWVPMLDGLDVLLQRFLSDVRPKFPEPPVLFADESGGALHEPLSQSPGIRTMSTTGRSGYAGR